MAELNIEQIVAQVLAEMKGVEAPKAAASAPAAGCIATGSDRIFFS